MSVASKVLNCCRWALSGTSPFRVLASSESIPSGGIPSLNHDAIPWHRGTQRIVPAGGQDDSGVSSYLVSHLSLSVFWLGQ